MSKPIVIFTIGTQGDIRPCVALGQGLHRAGYPVRIATSANFAELVREAGTHLATGFLSTPYLCPVLGASDHLELAYALLKQDTQPSWLYAVKKGATTSHVLVDIGNAQIVTASVHDAWLLSGKNEEAFFDIVEQLAQMSAEKRGLQRLSPFPGLGAQFEQ